MLGHAALSEEVRSEFRSFDLHITFLLGQVGVSPSVDAEVRIKPIFTIRCLLGQAFPAFPAVGVGYNDVIARSDIRYGGACL